MRKSKLALLEAQNNEDSSKCVKYLELIKDVFHLNTKEGLEYSDDPKCLAISLDSIANSHLGGDENAFAQRIAANTLSYVQMFESNSARILSIHTLKISFVSRGFPANCQTISEATTARRIGSLAAVTGTLLRKEKPVPYLVVAVYYCESCQQQFSVNLMSDQPNLSFNHTCQNCKKQIKLDDEQSSYENMLEFQLQEERSNAKAGGPRNLVMRAFGARPPDLSIGAKINACGIVIPTPLHRDPKTFTVDLAVRSVFLLLASIKPQKQAEPAVVVAQPDVENIANMPNVLAQLCSAFAPEIYGMNTVKEVLLLCLVGGVGREVDGTQFRGEIHGLVVGNAGIAKSQLLLFLVRNFPNAFYASGKGSSSAGLTASVSIDPGSSTAIVHPGLLTTSRHIGIDEFEKMPRSVHASLLETMEQQTVTIVKAGVFSALNARVSVIAAANPRGGKFDSSLTLQENTDISIPLLSRFDLLVVERDVPDEDEDRKLARHVLSMYLAKPVPEAAAAAHPRHISIELLRAYIERARLITPTISEHVQDLICKQYSLMRQDLTEVCTPRNIFALIRLSEAMARLHLHNEVREEDFDRVKELLATCNELRNSVQVRESKENQAYTLYQEMARKFEKGLIQSITVDDLCLKALYNNIPKTEVDRMIQRYTEYGVIVVDSNDVMSDAPPRSSPSSAAAAAPANPAAASAPAAPPSPPP